MLTAIKNVDVTKPASTHSSIHDQLWRLVPICIHGSSMGFPCSWGMSKGSWKLPLQGLCTQIKNVQIIQIPKTRS